MSQSQQEEQPVLGFITIVKSRQIGGMMGGYLILNRNGRPVEFHCTAPVRPSKFQKILYGPTLDSFLMGEQIARALVLRSTALPKLLLTDLPEVQSLRSLVTPPVMLVEAPPSGAASASSAASSSADTNESTGPDNVYDSDNNLSPDINSDAICSLNLDVHGQSSPVSDARVDNAAPIQELNPEEMISAAVRHGQIAPAARTELAIVEPANDDGSNDGGPNNGKACANDANDTIIVPKNALLWCGTLLYPDKSSLTSVQNEDRRKAEAILRELEIDYDLAEPFERIRDAICEAQKTAA